MRKGSEVRPAAISKFLAASEEAIEDFEPKKREIDEIEMSQPSQQFAKPQTPGHKKRKPNEPEEPTSTEQPTGCGMGCDSVGWVVTLAAGWVLAGWVAR